MSNPNANRIIISNSYPNAFAQAFADEVAAIYRDYADDIGDVVDLFTYQNGECCPTMLFPGEPEKEIGHELEGKKIYLVSTTSSTANRTELLGRTQILLGAIKENGGEDITLIEPDLFFSAQDRGPRNPKKSNDKSRFRGQGFSAKVYADALASAGVKKVVYVHNHSPDIVKSLWADAFHKHHGISMNDIDKHIYHIDVAPLISKFMLDSNYLNTDNGGENIRIILPDENPSIDYLAKRIIDYSGLNNIDIVPPTYKERLGEKEVKVVFNDDFDPAMTKGKQCVFIDDMLRTGGTLRENAKLYMSDPASRPEFMAAYITHAYIEGRTRDNTKTTSLSDIIATNTIPNVTERDIQGKLRRKMTVLKIEPYLANLLPSIEKGEILTDDCYKKLISLPTESIYNLERSSKHYRVLNERFKNNNDF